MTNPAEELTQPKIFKTWWPLAASWLLMAIEQPMLAAVIARLPDPEVHLAAWGGIVFSISLIIEAPIIMMLAASTALSQDWDSYQRLRSYMMWIAGSMTLLHVLIAFTPLYDFLANTLLSVPNVIVEPGRIGLRLMVPWTWAIAYRRFNQGALIRFGHSRAVSVGTLVRLVTDGSVLLFGLLSQSLQGIVVASGGIILGVIAEAVYAGWRVRPVLREQIKPAPKTETIEGFRDFIEFYVPLAMTSVITLFFLPIGSAALSRMPAPLESLAVWPVITGLLFVLRSFGVAYNEAVVALLEHRGAYQELKRFNLWLIGGTSGILVLLLITPLAGIWFREIAALSPELVGLARRALWFGLPIPALSVLISWFQGILLHHRRTRGITEAVGFSLGASIVTFLLGIAYGRAPGLYVGVAALSTGGVLQTLWLRWRSGRVSSKAAARR